MDRFEIDPRDTALLVIDVQYLDAHREWGFGKTAAENGEAERFAPFYDRVEDVVLPSASELQNTLRSAGYRCLHTRIAAQTFDCRDMSEGFKRRGILAPPGSKEAEILPEVAPREGEVVLDKLGASPFNSTGIDQTLRNLGVRHLFLAGVVTNGCVELTARDAADRGYFVTLVEDGCAAMSEQLHQDALTRVATAMIQLESSRAIGERVAAGP